MRPIEWCRKVTVMTVVQLVEWDNPKDPERHIKQLKYWSEVIGPYWDKLVKEKGIKVESTAWSDNTGHMINWNEFETVEDFAKLWEDEGWQQRLAAFQHLLDNMRIRLLRPSLTIPEELHVSKIT